VPLPSCAISTTGTPNTGRKAPNLYEQVLLQREGYAIILLTIEHEEDKDEDEDAERTSNERYGFRQNNWQG
jgi:hypothetical protein